jgi:hypothetical protein
MQNGTNTTMRTRGSRPASPFAARATRIPNVAAPMPKGTQNAKRNYERYLELAQAEALTGNSVGAENYYQHAEHYFRSMSSE